MDSTGRDLSTADLARTGDEMRGRADEQVVNRASLQEQGPLEPETFAARPAVGTAIGDTGTTADRTAGSAIGPTDPTGAAGSATQRDAPAMLFPVEDVDRLRTQWSEIQATFVDSPRQAVERADSLVADAMKRLATTFASERSNLERQWDRGGDVTTEDLRVTLQRYRAFFDRLLSV